MTAREEGVLKSSDIAARSDPFPDGLAEHHVTPRSGLHRHANPLSILLLGGFLAAAFLGWMGGKPSPRQVVDTADARLTVKSPRVIRNGEFFEAQIEMLPHRAFQDLTMAVSPSLWRDLTQNSMIPQATEEKMEDGLFTFAYGPVEAGKPVLVKIDFQINPALVGTLAGVVAVRDGKRTVATLPVEMTVRP